MPRPTGSRPANAAFGSSHAPPSVVARVCVALGDRFRGHRAIRGRLPRTPFVPLRAASFKARLDVGELSRQSVDALVENLERQVAVADDIRPGRDRHPPRLRLTILIEGHAGPPQGGSGRGGSGRNPLDLRPPFTLQGQLRLSLGSRGFLSQGGSGFLGSSGYLDAPRPELFSFIGQRSGIRGGRFEALAREPIQLDVQRIVLGDQLAQLVVSRVVPEWTLRG